MSAFNFFREHQYSPFAPVHRSISNAVVANTITLKSPITGGRLAITNVVVSAAAADGSIAFYFGGKHDNDTPIAVYNVKGSSTVVPRIQCWETTATDSPLEVMVSTGVEHAWEVQVEGFDLYDN